MIIVLIDEAADMFLHKLDGEVSSIMDNITAIGVMKHHLEEVLRALFGSRIEIIYVPAGRSLLAFAIILEKRNTFFIMEQPEAHLFPIAQKDMISLIALMTNVTGSKVIITTHSLYILTSINILLFSEKVEGVNVKNGKTAIPKNLRIPYSTFAVYKVGKFEKSLESLLDQKSHMIDTDYIDEVSAITNSELEQLMDMEAEE